VSHTDQTPFRIGEDSLDLAAFLTVCHTGRSAVLSPVAVTRINYCDAFRRELVASDDRIYGVNTGFGKLADTVIPLDQQAQLQKNLIRSHAVGWGTPLSRAEVRGMILLRALSLSHGYSGVRVALVDQLLWLLEADLYPWIPSRGSVGASGDLAPLAHLALVLMGEGHVLDSDGRRQPSGPVLAALGRKPLELEAKEGLALINGTQFMNSLGLLAAGRARRLVGWATLAGALSLEALEGTALPFDGVYQSLRPHAEIQAVAASLRNLLAGSGVVAGHHDCPRVQDPYSLRCQPQVLGSSLMVLNRAQEIFLDEAAAVTDNPVLLPDEKRVVTGGHFHGQPIAHQLDFCYQAVCEICGIAERRINLLLGGNGGRLPRFLAAQPGLESGLMIAQYLAAGLVSENKSKAFPAAVDSIPTSDNQEDHVSMGSVAALKLSGVLDRAEAVVGLELLTAARALQFIIRPDLAGLGNRLTFDLSAPLAALVSDLGAQIDLSPGDRPLTDDLTAVTTWMAGTDLDPLIADCLAPLSLVKDAPHA